MDWYIIITRFLIYILGVNTNAAHRPIPYSVTFFMLGFADQKPVILNNAQPQLGYSFVNEVCIYRFINIFYLLVLLFCGLL